MSEVPLYRRLELQTGFFPGTSRLLALTNPGGYSEREFIDYTTSMITDEDPLQGLLFYWDLGFSHTLHVLTAN